MSSSSSAPLHSASTAASSGAVSLLTSLCGIVLHSVDAAFFCWHLLHSLSLIALYDSDVKERTCSGGRQLLSGFVDHLIWKVWYSPFCQSTPESGVRGPFNSWERSFESTMLEKGESPGGGPVRKVGWNVESALGMKAAQIMKDWAFVLTGLHCHIHRAMQRWGPKSG